MCRPGFTRASKVSSARTRAPSTRTAPRAIRRSPASECRPVVSQSRTVNTICSSGVASHCSRETSGRLGRATSTDSPTSGPAGSSPGSPMIRTIPGSSGPVIRASRIGVPATTAEGRSPASARISSGVRSSASNTPKMLRPAAIRERDTSILRAAGFTSRIRPLSSTTPTGTSSPVSTANRTSRSRVSSACALSSCSVSRSSAVACRSASTLTARSTAVAPARRWAGFTVAMISMSCGLSGIVALLGAPRAPRHPSDPRHQHDQAERQDEPLGAERVEKRAPALRRQVRQDHGHRQAGHEGCDRDEREDPPPGHDPPPGESERGRLTGRSGISRPSPTALRARLGRTRAGPPGRRR